MTKKDYAVIAEAIAAARKELAEAELAVVDRVTSFVTFALAQANPNFDQDRFKVAAHYRVTP